MALIGFQEKFEVPIIQGEKHTTIRLPRKRPIKIGEQLHLYTGLRTKKAKKIFGVYFCKGVDKIRIFSDGIEINDEFTNIPGILNDIAHTDGFPDFSTLRGWFDRMYGLPFVGIRIWF